MGFYASVVVWRVIVSAGAYFDVDGVDGDGFGADEKLAPGGFGFGEGGGVEVGVGAVVEDADGAHGGWMVCRCHDFGCWNAFYLKLHNV